MATSAPTAPISWDDPYTDSHPAEYTSIALRLFLGGLEQRREAQVLDMGPTCGNNISFFAQRVRRLYLCDMFIRLDRDRRRGLSPGQVWRHLDYAAQSFDGILLWDLFDRLEDREVGMLVELCHTMVKPGGILMLCAAGKQVIPPVVNSFVIGDSFRLQLRQQPHLDLPLNYRQNRDVLAMLVPFTPVKSFTYRNALREFLFKR